MNSSTSHRPHQHDYWYGATRLDLFNDQVAVFAAHNHVFDEPPRDEDSHNCASTLLSTSQGGSVRFSLPPGQIVLPGTSRLQFTFDWTDRTITGLHFMYRTADAHDYVDVGELANGRTIELNLTPPMTDAGHTTSSKWGFALCSGGSARPEIAQGNVYTHIVALRDGDVPFEPAHPNRWSGARSLILQDKTWAVSAVSVLNKGDNAWIEVPFAPGAIVPAETSLLHVNVTFAAKGATASVDPASILVYYRDSSVANWIYRQANATRGHDGLLDFQIDVDHNMADGVYANETNWDVWVRLVSQNQMKTPAGYEGAPHADEGSLHVVVTAIADPTRASME